MNELVSSYALLLVVIWPLLLAGAMALKTTRPMAMRFTPWAALPALATSIGIADTSLQLPGVILGSSLVLDDIGRMFLLLCATLFLVTGLIARPNLLNNKVNHFAILLLLTMTGGFTQVLTGDAILFFAAGTLSGYALYGLLVHDADVSTQAAGRVFVVLLVVSDLMVFELILLLGQVAGTTEFLPLRQAFINIDNPRLMLGLLIVGFGIKAGVVGVHFWLMPVFINAKRAVLPALTSFMLCAGLLGWLRLLPLGEIYWIGSGVMLQWLAWLSLGYAVFAGLLNVQFRGVLTCAAMVITGMWVAMLGSTLQQPLIWHGMADAANHFVLQTGFALTALLLLDRPAFVTAPKWLHFWSHAVRWLAALQLAAAPMAVTGHLMKVDGIAEMQMFWAMAVVSFLVVRGLLLIPPVIEDYRDLKTSQYVIQQSTQPPTETTLLAAGVLTIAGLLAGAYNLLGVSPIDFWQPVLMMSATSLAGWLSVKCRIPLLHDLPLLAPMNNGLSAALYQVRHLADKRLPLWRDAGLALVRRLWSSVDWLRIIGRIESSLNHWHTALTILVLLGLVTVALGAIQ